MAWSKDAASRAPLVVYTAPPEAYPMVEVVYDPSGNPKWSVLYEYLGSETDTVTDVEALMGL